MEHHAGNNSSNENKNNTNNMTTIKISVAFLPNFELTVKSNRFKLGRNDQRNSKNDSITRLTEYRHYVRITYANEI